MISLLLTHSSRNELFIVLYLLWRGHPSTWPCRACSPRCTCRSARAPPGCNRQPGTEAAPDCHLATPETIETSDYLGNCKTCPFNKCFINYRVLNLRDIYVNLSSDEHLSHRCSRLLLQLTDAISFPTSWLCHFLYASEKKLIREVHRHHRIFCGPSTDHFIWEVRRLGCVAWLGISNHATKTRLVYVCGRLSVLTVQGLREKVHNEWSFREHEC